MRPTGILLPLLRAWLRGGEARIVMRNRYDRADTFDFASADLRQVWDVWRAYRGVGFR